jgi:hypothetical protein
MFFGQLLKGIRAILNICFTISAIPSNGDGKKAIRILIAMKKMRLFVRSAKK